MVSLISEETDKPSRKITADRTCYHPTSVIGQLTHQQPIATENVNISSSVFSDKPKHSAAILRLPSFNGNVRLDAHPLAAAVPSTRTKK